MQWCSAIFLFRRITIRMNIKWTITLPPKIMEVKKMVPSNSSFLSLGVVFHFHDCGKKGSSFHDIIQRTSPKTPLGSFSCTCFQKTSMCCSWALSVDVLWHFVASKTYVGAYIYCANFSVFFFFAWRRIAAPSMVGMQTLQKRWESSIAMWLQHRLGKYVQLPDPPRLNVNAGWSCCLLRLALLCNSTWVVSDLFLVHHLENTSLTYSSSFKWYCHLGRLRNIMHVYLWGRNFQWCTQPYASWRAYHAPVHTYPPCRKW